MKKPSYKELEQRIKEIESLTKLIETNADSLNNVYKLFLNCSNDAIIVTLVSGEIVDANQIACDLFEYKLTEITQLNYKQLLHPKYSTSAFKLIAVEHQIQKAETLNIKKSGVSFNSETKITFINKDNETYILAIIKDNSSTNIANEKLLFSESKFKIISEVSDEGIIIHNFKEVLDINPSFAKMFGCEPSDFIGKGFKELIKYVHPRFRKIFEHNLYKTAPKYYIKACKKDNSEFAIEIDTKEFDYKNENIRIAAIRDISAKKTTNKALKNSELKYQKLLIEAPLAIITVDLNGNIQFANKTMLDLMGSPSFEETQKINLFTFPPLIKVGLPDKIKKCIETGERIIFEHPYISKWGKSIYFRSHVTTTKDNENKINGILLIAEDFSIYKEVEQKEKEYNDKQTFLSNTALEFLSLPVDIDIYQHICEKLFKIIGDSIIVIDAFNHEKNTSKIIAVGGVKNIIEQSKIILDKDYNEVEFPFDSYISTINKTGKLFEINGSFHSFSQGVFNETACKTLEQLGNLNKIYIIGLNINNECFGSINILTLNNIEITDAGLIETFVYQSTIAINKRHVEKQLIIAKEKAVEADRLKSAFLANMSHELRIPLNSIIGFSDLLAISEPPQKQKQEYLSYIKNSGNLLLELVNDIIDLAKIEADQMKINKTKFKINDLLLELFEYFDEYRLLQERHDLKLILNQQNFNYNYVVNTDKLRLKQILSNLIGNAIKFTSTGFVEFGFVISEDIQFEFFVKDSGIGIPKDKQSLIFERFAQLEETSTKKYKGTGLGLSISKRITELLGGNMWVESIENKGSTFYFTIPIVDEEKYCIIPIANNKLDKCKFNWQNKVILIVEDEIVNFSYLEEVLQKTQAQIIWAKNGKEAIELCKTNNLIDLVLMDIKMPLINGYEATVEIKKFRKDLPIIAQTALAMHGEKEKSLIAGCNDYITKPIKQDTLLEVINQFINLN